MCFILSDLKCYESITSSSRNHLWNAKEKGVNEKNKENKSFLAYKMFFFFLLFEPFQFSNVIIIIINISF